MYNPEHLRSDLNKSKSEKEGLKIKERGLKLN